MYHCLEEAMRPLWLGNTIHQESVMFVPDARTGAVAPAPLLFPPEAVLRVSSTDAMVRYQEGRDYAVERGALVRLPEGRLPCFARDDYYLPSPGVIAIESVRCPGRYVRVEPGGIAFARHQVAVTYRHGERWKGPMVRSQTERLPRTLSRLRAKEPLTMVFYGDSVMEGCDATGKSGIAPYLPQCDELFVIRLAQRYKHPGIRRINTAVGGMDSGWGRENASERLARHAPDLAVLCFGMNDGSRNMPVEEYEANLRAIIDAVRRERVEAEFMLLSSGLPNPDCKGWTGLQAAYPPVLDAIASDTPGCCHVPIMAIHEYLYERKRYDDMSGNGVNHPNDFLVRVNAQAMAACLLPLQAR